MRLIKLAIISIFILFGVATAISLLIPSHIRISKALSMRAHRDSIFAPILDTARWGQWHPVFQQSDSAVRQRGAIHRRIRERTDSTVVIELQQGDKTPVLTTFRLYEHEGTGERTLQWYMDFHLSWYPWQKFGSLFFENTYGVMMEQGLSNLKELSE